MNTIKSIFINISFALALTLSLSMCSDNKNNANEATDATKPKEDSKAIAEEHNDAKFDSNKLEKRAQVMVNAAEMNLEQIQFAQIAQRNGSPEIREIAAMIEKEHSKAQQELKTLAASKIVTIPTTVTEDGMNEYNKIDKKEGADFNKAYCDIVVNSHKQAISDLEKVATDNDDSDIRNWATSMLPGLRTHLDKALTCQKKLEDKKVDDKK